MEFDEGDELYLERDIQISGNYLPLRNSAGTGETAPTAARKGGGAFTTTATYRYRECLKNHAVSIGCHAVDGCGEFMPAGYEGTLDALRCAACNCHRNFHRKEREAEKDHHQFSTYHHRTPHLSGYLLLTPPPDVLSPLALPSTSRDDEGTSNPRSSGGGGAAGNISARKKRFRTKFTQEQKEKMLSFAERLGWRIQKHDEAAVLQFCAETNVKRHVLKVWMHNNKHTLGRQP